MRALLLGLSGLLAGGERLGAARAAVQDGRVELTELSSEQSANLVVLGKVWGFLKYHHPLVAAGKEDWDAWLFRGLPRVLAAGTRAEGNAVLARWCGEVGEPEPCSPCAEPVPDAQLQPRIGWIEAETVLGAELSGYLRRVHANRRARRHPHHVVITPTAPCPIFKNEDGHADELELDAGLRLLGLFRFWNLIEYWSPYRDLLGDEWEAVLVEFVPRVVAAEARDDYGRELVQLIARVRDTHTNLWSSLELYPPRGERELPVQLRFVEGVATVIGLVDTQPPTGLRRGDAILALDGRQVEELVAEWAPFYGASNEASLLRDIAQGLTRGQTPAVHLRVERGGSVLDLQEQRTAQTSTRVRPSRDLPGETFRLLTPEIGYLTLSSLEVARIPAILTSAEGTRGLVIDLRCYPKEFLVFELGQHLVAEPTEVAVFTQSVPSNPGAFVRKNPVVLKPSEPRYGGRLAILVDETTQSQSEYTAMAFRAAPGALVIGSTTAGADGDVATLPLVGGFSTRITRLGVFYPDGRPTQRVGIVPDLEVRPTLAGIRAGRDEVLEAALGALLGGEVPQEELQRIVRAAQDTER